MVLTLAESADCTHVAVVVTVRQALQLQTPTAKALSVSNTNKSFFFIPVFDSVDKYFDVFECLEVDEYAAGTMFRLGTKVDADAFSVGYVAYLGHEFSELRRPSEAERIRALRDEEVSVLESWIGQRGFRVEGQGKLSPYCLSRCLLAD